MFCSFGLLRVPFLNVYQSFVCSCPFGFEDGIWYLVVLVPDHCHSIYFPLKPEVGSLAVLHYFITTYGQAQFYRVCYCNF